MCPVRPDGHRSLSGGPATYAAPSRRLSGVLTGVGHRGLRARGYGGLRRDPGGAAVAGGPIGPGGGPAGGLHEQHEADQLGIDELRDRQRPFSAGLRGRRERPAHAQLARADPAVPRTNKRSTMPTIWMSPGTAPAIGPWPTRCPCPASSGAPVRPTRRAARKPATP